MFFHILYIVINIIHRTVYNLWTTYIICYTIYKLLHSNLFKIIIPPVLYSVQFYDIIILGVCYYDLYKVSTIKSNLFRI